jgi:hypothetical protein
MKKATYRYQATEMNVVQFARLHGNGIDSLEIKLWGNPFTYSRVTVDGIDYLFRLSNGVYDGRNIEQETINN